jgi:hypothetical protein
MIGDPDFSAGLLGPFLLKIRRQTAAESPAGTTMSCLRPDPARSATGSVPAGGQIGRDLPDDAQQFG